MFSMLLRKGFLKAELSGMKLTKESFKLDTDQLKALHNVAPDASDTK